MKSTTEPIIICGAGLAGLALARALAETPSTQPIVVIDPDFDTPRQRTWSFWGEIPLGLAGYVERTWDTMRVATPEREVVGPLGRQPYRTIRGSSFGQGLVAELSQCPRVRLIRDEVRHVHDRDEGVIVNLSQHAIRGGWAFLGFGRPPAAEALLQHFGGFEVETSEANFDPACFTLMEFGPPADGPAFYYVLPFTRHRALIEYTVFSDHPRPRDHYDARVESWLRDRVRGDWTVLRREYGAIPMDPERVEQRVSPHVFRIGAAGGMTKPSTGYTFRRTIRQVEHLATSLAQTGVPQPLPPSPPRFAFYDQLLIRVLKERPERASEVFMRLFSSNRFEKVFEFLDERTRTWSEARLIGSLPFEPFLRTLAPGARPEPSLLPKLS